MIKILNKLIFIIKILINKNHFYNTAKSQNNNEENEYIEYLSGNIQNRYFVEIGFHNLEFNSINLVKKNFSGLMIDGGRFVNVLVLKVIFFILKKKISIKWNYVKKNNIINLLDTKKIGIFSIDIDGNDFWILKEVLDKKIYPEVIICEYNASFLNHSITVPYEDSFNRILKHPSGFYHGASLSALYSLMSEYNYYLVKNIAGVNLFFVNKQIKDSLFLNHFKPDEIYQEGKLRNKWSKLSAKEQYDKIKHLKFVNI